MIATDQALEGGYNTRSLLCQTLAPCSRTAGAPNVLNDPSRRLRAKSPHLFKLTQYLASSPGPIVTRTRTVALQRSDFHGVNFRSRIYTLPWT